MPGCGGDVGDGWVAGGEGGRGRWGWLGEGGEGGLGQEWGVPDPDWPGMLWGGADVSISAPLDG